MDRFDLPLGTPRRHRRTLVLLLALLTVLVAPASGATHASHTPFRLALGDHPQAPAPARPDGDSLGEALAKVAAPGLHRGLYVLAVATQPPPVAASVMPPENAPAAVERAQPASAAAPPPRSAAEPPSPSSACPDASMTEAERSLFDAINGERTTRGMPELEADGCLVHVARLRADDMATRGYFAHIGPGGETAAAWLDSYSLPWALLAENLARNNALGGEAVALAIRDLMASESHRVNILSREVARLGVGHALDASGMSYFVMLFIAR